MHGYRLRDLLYANFDKCLLAFLYLLTGLTVMCLIKWGGPQELVIRIEDAFSALLGALIALVTNNHDAPGKYGVVLSKKEE